MNITLTSDKYIVSKTEDSKVVHLIHSLKDSNYSTGLPIVEQFDTLEEAALYVDEIKGKDYTKENYSFLFEKI